MISRDEKYIRRALFIAETLSRYASPNPRVGAVIVRKGRIVGEGVTGPYGGPHAEVVALRKAGSKAKGSTLYVTLEPCSHYGKTPPCVEAVIRSGVRKVVAAMKDPNPLVRGKGFEELRKAGIIIKSGLLEKEAREINEHFVFSMTHHRPWVILKAALSMDGKIASEPGGSKWITGSKARRKAHELRAKVDAILVGRKTAWKDDPSLTVRLPGFRREDGWPLRVLLDSKLRTSPESGLFKGEARTVVFTSPAATKASEKALVKKGVFVFRVPCRKKMLSLGAVLRLLNTLQVRSLLVEGGGEVHSSFLREKLVDEVVLFIAPKLLGKKALGWAGVDGNKNLISSPTLKQRRLEWAGVDLMLTGKMKG